MFKSAAWTRIYLSFIIIKGQHVQNDLSETSKSFEFLGLLEVGSNLKPFTDTTEKHVTKIRSWDCILQQHLDHF